MEAKTWDLFISHASEDKESIVRKVADELIKHGVNVWYDEFTLKIGDSLSRSIDRGLSSSKYGLVILSKAFLSKDWPEYELRGLTAKELGHEKVILPIWHNIEREDILQYSPSLADKFALTTKDNTNQELIYKIIEIVRPDLFEKIMRKIAYSKSLISAKMSSINTQNISLPPLIHESLPDDLINRIRLIRASLLSVYPHSMEYWVDGFRHDAHPTNEIAWWEFLSCCYLEYIQLCQSPLTKEQYKSVFNILLLLLNNHLDTKSCNSKDIELITKEGFEVLCNIVKYNYPFYDIEEELPQSTMEFSISDLDEYKKQFCADEF
jgi:hypothetical protein